METVVIVIHLMVVVAMIGVVLIQRSEGGALGIGGGNFMSARGQGNMLTRATTILGIAFFGTSLVLSVLARLDAPPSSILDTISNTDSAPPISTDAPADTGTGTTTGTGTNLLDTLRQESGGGSAGTSAPATDSGATTGTGTDTGASGTDTTTTSGSTDTTTGTSGAQ